MPAGLQGSVGEVQTLRAPTHWPCSDLLGDNKLQSLLRKIMKTSNKNQKKNQTRPTPPRYGAPGSREERGVVSPGLSAGQSPSETEWRKEARSRLRIRAKAPGLRGDSRCKDKSNCSHAEARKHLVLVVLGATSCPHSGPGSTEQSPTQGQTENHYGELLEQIHRPGEDCFYGPPEIS